MSNFADEVTATASQVFSSAEFAHYTEHKDKLLGRMRAGFDALEDRLRPLREEHTAELGRLGLRRNHMRIAMAVTAIMIGAAWVPASRAVNSMQNASLDKVVEVLISWARAIVKTCG